MWRSSIRICAHVKLKRFVRLYLRALYGSKICFFGFVLVLVHARYGNFLLLQRCKLLLKICATQELIHWPEAVTDVQSDYIVVVAIAHLPHE